MSTPTAKKSDAKAAAPTVPQKSKDGAKSVRVNGTVPSAAAPSQGPAGGKAPVEGAQETDLALVAKLETPIGTPAQIAQDKLAKIAEGNSKEVNKNFLQRLTYIKRGRDFFNKNDYNNTIYSYHLYFKALSEFFSVPQEEISPDLFDKELNVTETLTISQLYWDLVRIYGQAPHLYKEFKLSLDRFIKFTLGFKYQVVNSEMLRKYIKKNPKHSNLKDLQLAYQQIYVVSKNCYLATYCYGEDDPIIQELRQLKTWLLKSTWGDLFVEKYYQISPKLILFSESHPIFGDCLRMVVKRPIFWVNKAAKKLGLS